MKNIIEYYAKAFEAWENDYRANPQEYLTPEEASEIGVSQLSADRANYFYHLMREMVE
jgi:hypothetical protein